jgi:hypothetical protein
MTNINFAIPENLFSEDSKIDFVTTINEDFK